MQPFRVGRMALVASLGLMGMNAAEPPVAAAGQAQPLLQPTPLVLKDGRIASVSIHKVPFAPGRADVSAEARADLIELMRVVGTDCFLTAQVIGHIESSEVARDDTLNAHRLARSRADAVQASLIERGLPAKAIASVWDWQFMAREARATVWIFQLTAGEDCEGRPLREDMVAQAPRPSVPPASPGPSREPVVAAVAPAEPAPEGATAQGRQPWPAVADRAIVAAVAPAEAAPAQETARAPVEPRGPLPLRPQPEPESEGADVPTITQPLPTAAPVPAPAAEPAKQAVAKPAKQVAAKPAKQAVTEPAKQAVVAVAPDQAPPPARKTATDAKIETDPEGRLVITFATNSSYFPPGAGRQLSRLLSDVDPTKRHEVSLQVAVSGATKVVGAKSPAEATRYNKWLAERRLERVQEWLAEHTDPDRVSIRPEYLEADESRRVVVRVAPVG
jgi:outer membrane protein OmpA-like peptidoglycan-associated protein